jgi:hypothetical protein
MQLKLVRLFIESAGVLLIVTAIAKLVSSAGSARILLAMDPLLKISFREVFWVVGAIELIIGLFCLTRSRTILQLVLTAWLSTGILLYRVGLSWIDYAKPCFCLGNLADALHIPPPMVDTAMKCILLYLLIGSYGMLLWLWRQKWTSLAAMTSSETLNKCPHSADEASFDLR